MNDDKMAGIRIERNRLLSLCDWTQMPDASLTVAQKQIWVLYRQELRDLPLKFTEPNDVIWPTHPDLAGK
jgi:hypothetical protein